MDRDEPLSWLKVVVSRSGRWAVFAGPADPERRGRPARVVILPWRRHRLDPTTGIKSIGTAGSMLGLEEAERRGADDGLWLNDRGHAIGACTANLFVASGSALVTPALSLPSTTVFAMMSSPDVTTLFSSVIALLVIVAAPVVNPVVLLATANNPKLAEALMFNVEGVVFKQSDPKQLIRCLREVHAGRRWLDASVNQYAAATSNSDGQNLDTLTRRQIEVARAAVSGLSNKELAQRLGVSEGTIKNHPHAIYERLQLEGRLALLLYLMEKALA